MSFSHNKNARMPEPPPPHFDALRCVLLGRRATTPEPRTQKSFHFIASHLCASVRVGTAPLRPPSPFTSSCQMLPSLAPPQFIAIKRDEEIILWMAPRTVRRPTARRAQHLLCLCALNNMDSPRLKQRKTELTQTHTSKGLKRFPNIRGCVLPTLITESGTHQTASH